MKTTNTNNFNGTSVVGLVDGAAPNRDYAKNPVTIKIGTKDQKPAFGGKFTEANLGIYITKVMYNNPVTVVFFSDGTKTTCKAQKGDTYNKEMGLVMCVLKKLVGGDQVASLLKSWITPDKILDLKMVREYAAKESK